METRTLEEVKEVLEYVGGGSETRLTRIMLDNMVVPLENGDVDTTMLKDAVELINGRFETEVCVCMLGREKDDTFLTLNYNLMMQASGNVTVETVHKIGQSGVTFISRLHPQ